MSLPKVGGFPVIGVFFLCFCGPTLIFMLLPFLACRQRVPMTSIVVNLLTNLCVSGFSYGIYLMSQEDSFDIDKSELLVICCAAGVVGVFLMSSFRLLNFTCCSSKDSIGYVPAMCERTIFDVYTLTERLIELRSRPPMIFVEGYAGQLDEKGQLVKSWSYFDRVPFACWRDESVVKLEKSGLLDISVRMEYTVTPPLQHEIDMKYAALSAEGATLGSEYGAEVIYQTPGYSKYIFATTKGDVPDFVKFMRSSGGKAFRTFMRFIGYHSLLDCIWMLMFKKDEIVLRKVMSHDLTYDHDIWTPETEQQVLDYHSVPEYV